MSDLFRGQSMSKFYKFVSDGAAHTFTFNFQPDKVVFNNLTHWTGTAGELPISVWFRGQTTDTDAYQQQVVDTAAAQSFNFIFEGTNGFTVADTSGGLGAERALISGVTAADPCVVTTSAVHGFQNNQVIRFTDLGPSGVNATDRGMDELDGNRYRITVLSTTTFSLQDVISGEDIDSTSFVAWVAGGRVLNETRVISLNNPQVSPYDVTPYVPNQYEYDPVEYKLTAGSAIMGQDSDVFNIEVYKFGEVIDLGDIA